MVAEGKKGALSHADWNNFGRQESPSHALVPMLQGAHFLGGFLDLSGSQVSGTMRAHSHLESWALVYREELSVCG